MTAAVAVNQARWRQERQWLNQHRCELARLAVQLYPAEQRAPDTPLIAGPDWIPDEPVELRSLRLSLDEQEHGVADSVEPLRDALGFRALIGDPFDPGRRAIIPGVATLTIRLRRYPAEPSFLLHWRDSAKVPTAVGVYHVIPVGKFQPASVALWDRRNDFDLWRNIVREYFEELLGTPEHDGTRSTPIDYGSWPLYRELEDVQAAGQIVAIGNGSNQAGIPSA